MKRNCLNRIFKPEAILRITQMASHPQQSQLFVNDTSQNIIKENFERGTYSLMLVPRILEVDYSGVYVHKDGPYQDVIQSLEHMNWNRDRVLTPKLKAFSYGEYGLVIGLINAMYFESREKLDTLYSKEWEFSESCDPDIPVTTVPQISFEDALKLLTVSISCNMDYYLSNRDEMEKDLGRKLENLDVSNKDLMKQLELQLFYNQAVKIFGEDDSVDVAKEECGAQKSVTFTDFRRLFSDGNDTFATARRGNYYLVFSYVTS